MNRRLMFSVVLSAALFPLAEAQALAQDNPDVFISAGPTREILLAPDGMAFVSIFAGGGGFAPEEIALAGDGKLYICDASSSQIYRFDPAPSGGLTTIYERSSAISPNDPEQPKGCTIAGDDLLFLSRNGRGNNAKTGLWAIRDITTSPSQPTLLLGLDAVGGLSGQGLAVNFDGRVFFTFGNELWVATPQPGAGRVDGNSSFRIWGRTVGEGFGIASKGVPDPVTGALQTQVFVAAKFSGVIEVLQEVGGAGMSTNCSTIDVPNLPNSLEFDGAGDLWLTTSEQSSGRRGAVYEVDDPVCSVTPLTPVNRANGLSAAVGIALTPTGSDPVTLIFPPGSEKSGTVNLCNSAFNLDAVVQRCQSSWSVSCRLMPQAEFDFRTGYAVGSPAGGAGDLVEQDFQFTTCADFPGASGNCTEIRIKQVDEFSSCTEQDILDILANWQFFSLSSLDHPGLLYSPGDFPLDGAGDPIPEGSPFSDNILVDFDPLPVPTDPLDPRATGSRDAWGSGIVVVDDAPNRPPTAALSVTPLAAQCNEPVTLDGMASFDNDWNVDHRDSITNYAFAIDGVEQQSTAIDFYVHDTSGMSVGAHTATLEVADEGWDGQRPLTDTTSVTFQVTPDNSPPEFLQPVTLVPLGHPQVTISVDGQSATMWPPNHEMVPFELIRQVQDECTFSCEIKVQSNEPENGNGDGDVAPDFEITGETTVNLRSERAQSGNGRTYTITVECSDGANTSTSNPITVFVPSSQGGN